METKQAKDCSDIELKALGYDCMANIEQQQANLRIINQELTSRNKGPLVPKAEVKTDDTA